MKSFVFTLFAAFFICIGQAPAQRLINVEVTQQEQEQWCWAATSKCVMDYFHRTYNQCEIAEYARNRITWGDFGDVDCCIDASQGCNYWNYMYGTEGSILDILEHFAGILTQPIDDNLTYEQTVSQIDSDYPFIFRWGWSYGGGHFLVMHGYDGEYVDYMDPWFGEGKKISLFSWVIADESHEWTHTLPITLINSADELPTAELTITPNPVSDEIRIPSSPLLNEFSSAEIIDIMGTARAKYQLAAGSDFIASAADLPCGAYFVKLNGKGRSQVLRFVKI